MNALPVAASILLGVVFLFSGGTKLAAPDQWKQLASEFGVPRPIGRIVPWLELAVGALLVVQLWRPYVAAIALVILAAFTLAIVVQLLRGRHPACACFGAWSSAPLSGWHVARNLALMALAVVAML